MDWLDLIERAYQPESISDLVIVGLIFVIAGVNIRWVVKFIRTWVGFVRLMRVLTALALIYGVIVASVVPYFQRFPDTTIGVLLPRLSGARLSEHFGTQQLNEMLEIELRIQLRKLELDTLVSTHAVSWVADSESEAQRLAQKYNATAVFWGSTTKLESNASIRGFFETGVTSFRVHHPVTGVLQVAFWVSSYPTYPLRFGDSTYNLPSLARNVILDVVPLLASKVSAKDPLRAADLIKRLSREDKRFAEWPYAGYLVGWAAGLLEQNGKPSEAAKAYRRAFECLEQLIANIQSGRALSRIKEIEVWPWAAL